MVDAVVVRPNFECNIQVAGGSPALVGRDAVELPQTRVLRIRKPSGSDPWPCPLGPRPQSFGTNYSPDSCASSNRGTGCGRYEKRELSFAHALEIDRLDHGPLLATYRRHAGALTAAGRHERSGTAGPWRPPALVDRDGGNRTPTGFRPADFESAASTVPPRPPAASLERPPAGTLLGQGAQPCAGACRATPSASATSTTFLATAGATASLKTLGMM